MESPDEWSSRDGDEVATTVSLGIKCEQAAWDEDEEEVDKSECTSENTEDEEGEEEEDEFSSWDGELQTFLEETPEFRAKVQYQVRVVALIPGFEAAGRKLSLFDTFYKVRFGKSLTESTGFSSAEILCKSMPHIIQRYVVDKRREVVLVDSARNMRAVAGIRSGLRRIVFHVLSRHPKGISASSLERECSSLLGRPLSLVLSELAYDTSNVESMVRDMADIACHRQSSGEFTVFLSSEAEDPALTDGILSPSGGGGGDECLAKEGGNGLVSNKEVLEARVRMIVLLALHTDGVELSGLQKAYVEMYTEGLDSRGLGYSSTEELVEDWNDIILFRSSPGPEKVFLRACQESNRILSTLSSGLRWAVYSILQECYPDGLEPAELLSRLYEEYSEQMTALYRRRPGDKDVVGLKDTELHGFCVMVHDMMDLMTFGCRDDGTLILKLWNEGSPVVEFPDFNSSSDEFVEALVEGEGGRVIVDIAGNGPWNDLEVCHEEEMEREHALEHRVRLIFGSHHSGLSPEKFTSTYRERCGEEITVSQLKSFISKTPGLLRLVRGNLHLVESPKNLRIIQATRAGLRQLLHWALVKNPGGVWAELLDGWFTDFTGYSLINVLLKHGYSSARRKPLLVVNEFLDDMSDMCEAQRFREGFQFYVLVDGFQEDPAVSDNKLLRLDAEYDPVKLCMAMKGLHGNGFENTAEQQVERLPAKSDNENGYKYDPPRAYATPVVPN